jgi:hypothetical protein
MHNELVNLIFFIYKNLVNKIGFSNNSFNNSFVKHYIMNKISQIKLYITQDEKNA